MHPLPRDTGGYETMRCRVHWWFDAGEGREKREEDPEGELRQLRQLGETRTTERMS